MYTYYEKVELEEHMLYANEIALGYNKLYNLIGTDYELTDHKVSIIINKYCKKYLIENRPLYYKSRHAFKRVYPIDIVESAMNDYLKVNI